MPRGYEIVSTFQAVANCLAAFDNRSISAATIA